MYCIKITSNKEIHGETEFYVKELHGRHKDAFGLVINPLMSDAIHHPEKQWLELLVKLIKAGHWIDFGDFEVVPYSINEAN